MIGAFYNEWERYPAQWIRNLAAAGHVADGVVDERSIRDVRAADLVGRAQCHFFAGLAGWSYALRLAGWPDDRPVWTASCPCQPFSTAGKQRGFDDDRHLWPVLFELVRECRPAILFGEQVAGPAGRTWLDAVSADLESAGYAVGAANLCAAGCGAPHIRQRLYFVAVADADRDGRGPRRSGGSHGDRAIEPARRRDDERLADAIIGNRNSRDVGEVDRAPRDLARARGDVACAAAHGGADERLGHADGIGARRIARGGTGTQAAVDRARGVDGHVGHDADAPGPWGDAAWIACTDGKSRPAQPGVHPLVAGTANRVGRLRAYGNAIVAPLAAEFIGAVIDELDARSAT